MARATKCEECVSYDYDEETDTYYCSMFPPAYTSQFAKPSLGVVTKCDLATAEQVLEAEKHLTMAGAQKLFAVSSMTGQGVGDLIRYLDILWS